MEAQSRVVAPEPRIRSSEALPFGGITVTKAAQALIVDDSSTARIMLARMLERTGIKAEGVASAEEALAVLERRRVDLIFLDHLLPGMDGFAALRQLKSNRRTGDIPVFMYTSQQGDAYREEALELGAAGVIGKQISRQQLGRALQAISDGRSQQQSASPSPGSQETGHMNSEQDDPAQSIPNSLKPLTGRLSTLEIAYEEVNDEVRLLRQEVARLRAGDSAEFERHTRRMRWFAALLLLMMLATSGILWYQLETVRTLLQTVSNQSSVLKDIIAQLLTMVGH